MIHDDHQNVNDKTKQKSCFLRIFVYYTTTDDYCCRLSQSKLTNEQNTGIRFRLWWDSRGDIRFNNSKYFFE